MIKKLLVICTALVFIVAVFSAVQADEAVKGEEAVKAKDVDHAFVGAKKCKPCHKKDETFPTWETTLHAKAFESLPEDQRANEACLACHATGTTAKDVLLEGVQCEACHGAGADYKKKKVMEDHEASIAAGMLVPDEKTCERCHSASEGLPEGHAELAKIDYAKSKATGVHAIPEKEAK